MKRKNLLSGLLAGALVLTSVFVPGVKNVVNAEEYDLNEGLVASFSFDDENLKDSQGGEDASAIVTGLSPYTGRMEYVDGYDGGKGIQLGDYGLKLNRENLGENFTVSLWIKPDNTIQADQATLFLGYHNPEKWLAVAGEADDSTKYRFWGHGNGMSWTGLGTTDISADWHQLTLTGSSSDVKAYLDGEQWGTGNTNSPLLGSNQDIYLGVTFWDVEFTGAADEVKVYNRTLSEGEVYRLYDAETTPEELLAEGIAVTDSLSMVLDRTAQIDVSLHPVVADSNPEITYESSDEKVATVSADGTVTAVGPGEAEITTTVTIGETSQKGVTAVSVSGALDDRLVGSYDFEESLENGVEGAPEATALVTALNTYSGNPVYDEGRTGNAVRLGDYGLKLNLNDLGTEYTVSMWVKSDEPLAGNQVMLFMGYHNPEKWLAISGDSGDRLKFWANGVIGQWVTLASPVVPSAEWHQITVTGTEGKTTLYLDGITMGTSDSNDPLDGENADIYLGVNYWDPEYEGLIDDVKIYNIAMSESEVQAQAEDEFAEALQTKLNGAVEIDDLIGANESADAIKYDLQLPSSADGLDITWSSSKTDVIADDGTVVSPSEEIEVTLTGNVSYGVLSAEVSFTYTVIPLDREALDALIEEAEAIDTAYLSDISRTRLETAIQAAKDADSYTKAEKAESDLRFVMDNLEYKDEAVNPFAHIADPVTQIQLNEGDAQDLFSVPENISDYVTVEYSSENSDVATYADGRVNAVAAGKTIVTVTVTSNYDGFVMEYSTAVEVVGSSVPEAGEVTDTTDPADNTGNASLVGDASSLADAVLNEQDKEAVAAGADAQIYLTVSDITETVSDSDRALVEAIKGDTEAGMYLDVNLFKQIGDGDAISVDSIDGTVTITMTVPENLRNTDPSVERTYQLVRVFDGEGSLLACSYDEETGVLTFTTNTFGTYAIVYSDSEVDDPGTDEPGTDDPGTDEPGTDDPGTDEPGTDTPGDNTQKPSDTQNGNGQSQSGGDSGKAVQTGDTTNILPIAAACVLALAAAGTAVTVKVKRRK